MLTEENRKDILDTLLQTIKAISDEEYHRRAWIRGELPGTDFDEIVNIYSCGAEGILEHYKDFKITEDQFKILKKFDKKFTDFYEDNDWPHKFLDTPEWAEVVNLAKEVIIAFNYKPNN